MILVFVGAGGSAAVDLEQYPTTVGFFERLPDEIKNASLFFRVCQFLKDEQGKEIIDIEDVLETLDELQADFRKITDTKNITGWAMSGRLDIAAGTNMNSAALHQSIDMLDKGHIVPLSNAIKEQVYGFYATAPETHKLSEWTLLLEELEKIDPALEIFTTNYDLVLETVIKKAGGDVETGRVSDNIRTRLDTTFWKNRREGKRGLLTKLHGSVDWQLNNEEIIMSPIFTGNHQNHCILYPGYKGEPTEEPFSIFHEHLRNVVRGEYGALTAAVFIGFAFRDNHINSILADLPSETFKYVITKSDGNQIIDAKPPENAPASFKDNCLHRRDGLAIEAIKSCLENITTSMEGKPRLGGPIRD